MRVTLRIFWKQMSEHDADSLPLGQTCETLFLMQIKLSVKLNMR